MAEKKYLDIETARKAVEQLDAVGVTENKVFMDDLIPGLPRKVLWMVVDHQPDGIESWTIKGHFCGIPLYTINIYLEDGKKMWLDFQEAE